MAEGLAAAVMGEIALQSRRGQVAGVFPEGGARPGAARQARLWRAGQGGHAAVLKKIAQGGTHTPGELGRQLDYLFSKAEWCGGNALDYDPDRQSFTPGARKALVRTWSADWTRSPKNGHTTHLLMSFPAHVAADRARWIAGEWAEAMFQSPEVKGDAWHYVMALHTDRAHPHVHIIIQNRGVGRGRWFYMAKDHVFELQAMKARMAEIAASGGIKLESTTRIERGILSYSVDRSEIERARREDRPIRERVRSGAALRSALEEMKDVSKVYADLAFLARGMEARDVAARMEAA